jgi:23S rRNA (adenine2503-C2)-methyltransferase
VSDRPVQLIDLPPRQLAELVRSMGLPAYRGGQILNWLYRQKVASIGEMTNLPLELRESLDANHGLPALVVRDASRDEDGTTKYLFALEDGAQIESVDIPRPTGRSTWCLSSQVGCRMACTFCATGRMGMVRQLSAGEIVGQVLELWRRHEESTHPNLVFMGMGEPLDNLQALLPALEILTDPDGVGLSARRITVSTSGLVEGIQELGRHGSGVGLAVSLTTGDEAERRELMPVAGVVALDELLEVAGDYGRRVRRKVTLECAVIAGQNDDLDHARQLLVLARRGPFKINLIPLNPIEGFDGNRPERSRLDAMVGLLWGAGVVTTVRDSQGRAVDAACGQLVKNQERRPERAPRHRAVRRSGPR